jgi:hypothetical protein
MAQHFCSFWVVFIVVSFEVAGDALVRKRQEFDREVP